MLLLGLLLPCYGAEIGPQGWRLAACCGILFGVLSLWVHGLEFIVVLQEMGTLQLQLLDYAGSIRVFCLQ